ncbi:MAG: (Citrate (pro-3S)-lyase) ligase [Firmicutes bacterium]|nr:(Citrate (pro-3S)-lyase) ligase [candidate division NPL-UPA2 bacterium]
MWIPYEVASSQDKPAVHRFLEQFGLRYDAESDLTVEIRVDGEIVATGSLKGNVLQCVAVSPALHGEGLSGKIVHYLMLTAQRAGHTRCFIYTTPRQAYLFDSLGFRTLVKTQWAALLESGHPSFIDYLRQLEFAASKIASSQSGLVGGLVMNCNPFTLGHEYLVRAAAAQCEHVYLLVVQEDKSVFPFDVRFALVKQGTQRFKNVTVLPTGPYAVSTATFPSYFSEEETAHARAGASIDAALYGMHIARALKVRVRFVGTEPYSPVTAIYNQVLRETLQSHGIQLHEIGRLEQDGRAVSASLVRQALRESDFAVLPSLVPETTLTFLQSDAAADIIERLRKTTSRH